jgi:acyl carrier protein
MSSTAAHDGLLPRIYRIVDTFNAQLPPDTQLTKTPETVVVGPGGTLDSLSIVNLLVLLEEELGKELGGRVVLLDETLIAQATEGQGPLHNLRSIAIHVSSQA